MLIDPEENGQRHPALACPFPLLSLATLAPWSTPDMRVPSFALSSLSLSPLPILTTPMKPCSASLLPALPPHSNSPPWQCRALGGVEGEDTERGARVGWPCSPAFGLLLLPFLPVRLARVSGDTVQCLAALQLSALLGALSLYNISLATVLAVAMVPLAILATSRQHWSLTRLLVTGFSCLVNPFILTMIAATLDTIVTFPDISIMDIIVRSAQVSVLSC